MMCVLVMISPKQRQKTLYERIYRAKETNKEFREKESTAKRQKRSENVEAIRAYEKQAFLKRKASNPERIRELRDLVSYCI